MKSMPGNMYHSPGQSVEMVASVRGLHHHLIPATLNFTLPDAACPVNVIAGQAQSAE